MPDVTAQPRGGRRILERLCTLSATARRIVVAVLMLLLLLLVTLAALWQWWVIPSVDRYRPWLESSISRQTGLTARIGSVAAGWDGVRPELSINRFTLQGRQGQSLLSLERMTTSLSWWRLLLGQVRFSMIELDSPELTLVRTRAGHWQLGGRDVAASGDAEGGNEVLDWLLQQGGVSMSGGRLRVIDQQRQPARELLLERVDFASSQWFDYRTVNLGMNLPAGLGGRMSLSGRVHGSDPRRLDDWSGTLTMQIPDTDLVRLGEWLALLRSQERVRAGRGQLQLGMTFADARLEQLDAELKVSELKLAGTRDIVTFPQVDASFSWQATRKGEVIRFDGRRIRTGSGEVCSGCRIDFSRTDESRRLEARNVTLDGFNEVLPLLPLTLPAELAGGRFAGDVLRLQLDWQGAAAAASNWQAELAFRRLGVDLPALASAFSGLDGEIRLTPESGELSLSGQSAALRYPAQFIDPLQFTTLKLALDWQRKGKGWQVALGELQLANQDMAVDAAGRYEWPGQGLGRVMLDGHIPRMQAERVYRYLPRVIGDETLDWLRSALRAGQAEQGVIHWHGEVADFPHRDDRNGVFEISAQARGVTLSYADDWPAIGGIDGKLRFRGVGMEITAPRASISGVALQDVVTRIPDLEYSQHVLVNGKASGVLQNYLAFLLHSPLQDVGGGIPATLKAEGQGELSLQLDIPIDRIDATQVKGGLVFRAERLDFGPEVPLLQQAQGELEFDASQFRIKSARAQLLGGPIAISGASDSKGGMNFALNGEARSEQALKREGLPALLAGVFAYQGNLQFRPGGYELLLMSSLKGVSSKLPVPLRKSAETELPLRLKLGRNDAGRSLSLSLGTLLQADLDGRTAQPWRGVIVLGAQPQPLPKSGIAIAGGWSELAVQDWLEWWQAQDSAGSSTAIGVMPRAAELNFGRITGWGQQLQDVKLGFSDLGAGWLLKVQSRQASGQIISGGAGRPLQVRLEHLQLPLPDNQGAVVVARGPAASVSTGAARSDMAERLIWSEIDLQVARLMLKDVALGQLTLAARAIGNGWDYRELSLQNADGRLAMSGQWLPREQVPHSKARFTLESPDLGKLLARLGEPDALRRAPAKFSGELSWTGSSPIPDLASLEGKLHLDVASGRFAKVETGSAARLLSILSLQSLIRRVQLDFNDVVAEGMEFDSIKGDAGIERGVVRTANLLIDSPAAYVRFSGEANLVARTQNLKVKIVPRVGDTVAIAATVVNPIAGLATLALGKAFDDPFGQMISQDYTVTGSMADPQVKRIPRLELPRALGGQGNSQER
ncbi:YhdP family protein [Chitinilyticum piscinae]|uniref:TIGR02099 family protein n=1 Tax=Chitinilyticum piscinae TaxID=2866724 RepID=A0A8J7FHJ0_9NEIS|nr:YhdP family protein [Chitinilyticum piscinae]MBE9609340.1 TIGR02099 family protein [Chitinilyticum piscinae]